MSQVTESLCRAILNGAGVTRHELEQLARHWLNNGTGPQREARADERIGDERNGRKESGDAGAAAGAGEPVACLCLHAIQQVPGQPTAHDPRCRLSPLAVLEPIRTEKLAAAGLFAEAEAVSRARIALDAEGAASVTSEPVTSSLSGGASVAELERELHSRYSHLLRPDLQLDWHHEATDLLAALRAVGVAEQKDGGGE